MMPKRSTASSRRCGEGCSTRYTAAPARSGKTRLWPSPKVKASGGLAANRSRGTGWRTWREKVSAMARTSRWKCIVAFGLPVVPEVNASMHTSSEAVSTFLNVGRLVAATLVRSSCSEPP